MNMYISGYWDYEYVYEESGICICLSQDIGNMNMFTRKVEYVYVYQESGICICLSQDIGNMNMFTSGYWEYEYVYQESGNMNVYLRIKLRVTDS